MTNLDISHYPEYIQKQLNDRCVSPPDVYKDHAKAFGLKRERGESESDFKERVLATANKALMDSLARLEARK